MRFSLLLAFLLAASVHAGTYKWVDEHGVTHYGDRVPPEHKDRGNQELNKRGIVIKKTEPALTPEQRKAIADEREARKLEEKKAAEQKRQDDALLLTYTSIDEIELKKARDLQQVEHAIGNLQGQVQSAQERLNEQQKRSDSFSKTSKPVPPELASDIAESRDYVASLNSRIAQKVEESAEIDAKYEAYKRRFGELKGETPVSPPSHQPARGTPPAAPGQRSAADVAHPQSRLAEEARLRELCSGEVMTVGCYRAKREEQDKRMESVREMNTKGPRRQYKRSPLPNIDRINCSQDPLGQVRCAK